MEENSSVSVKKFCKRCGHEICPNCGDWCDVILYSKNDKGSHIAAESDKDYPVPCCDGACIIDEQP